MPADGSSATITNNVITGNSAFDAGARSANAGGIYCLNSSPIIRNNEITGNSATSVFGPANGGGILCAKTSIIPTSPIITNNTIADNSASGTGGGISCGGGTSPIITNTILWNNTSPNGNEIYLFSSSTITVSFSDVAGGQAGIGGTGTVNWLNGNIDADPLFDDAANGDYHLFHASPCIGAGTAAGAPTTDIEGNPRGTPPDMGAYENPFDAPFNTAPTANEDVVTANEDTAVIITLAGTDAGSDNLTFAIVTQPSDGSLSNLTQNPNIGTNDMATVTYTPNPNFNGTDSFTFTVNDRVETSSEATVTITVNPVNDEPSFVKGADQTVDEDAGAQTVTGWATAISPGPANESGQTLTFTVTTDNDSLFSVLPAIDPTSGDLTYTPADDANGSAIISVVLTDDGGGANDGDDTFDTETFTITVNPVNDEPSFVKGADQTVDEDAGAQTVAGWATAISKGPDDESGQTLTFTVTTDHNSLFSVLPQIDPASGDLTYTPAGVWRSYLGPQNRGQASDQMLTDDLGMIVVMKNPVDLRLKGDALGVDGVSTINLCRGTNLVDVPLRDKRLQRVSDLLSLEGFLDNATSIIVSDNGAFKVVAQPDDDGDIPITGGQSFILIARDASVAEITGEAWDNVSGSSSAAPPMALVGHQVDGQTPVLAVHGVVVDEVTGATKDGFHVTVRNLSTGATLNTLSGSDIPEGKYSLTFMNTISSRAIRVGDVLKITVQTPSPLIGVQPLHHIVSADEVNGSQVLLPDLIAYEIPMETKLLANYPNPFNPETWIPFRLAEDAFVSLTIYGIKGQVIRNIEVGHQPAAVYESREKAIYWDGRNDFGEGVASGVYFYTLATQGGTKASPYTATRKMLILK